MQTLRRNQSMHGWAALVLGGSVTIAMLIALPSGLASAELKGVTTHYGGPDSGIYTPTSIVTGPDGNLWFTNSGNNSIGSITTSGVISNYTAAGIDEPEIIIVGPDGNLWFTNSGANSIGSITTSGVVSIYTDNFHLQGPTGIAVGPDGNLWVTTDDGISRVNTSGVVTAFYSELKHPGFITAGPDGNLWFTNSTHNSIGRITTSGTITTFRATGIFSPGDIITGPDGALWFTNGNGVGRITTSGAVTIHTINGSQIHGITAGPDGNLWTGGGKFLYRITPAGTITAFGGHDLSDGPLAITVGPDGALWLPEFLPYYGSILRFALPVPSAAVSPPSGAPGTAVTVGGGGFVANESVTVSYKTGLSSPTSVTVCTSPVASDGTYSCAGSIPTTDAGALGKHKLSVTGGTSGAIAKATFTLTS